MMPPAVQYLYLLWNEPGQFMSQAWWEALGLTAWYDIYRHTPQVRPALNGIIRQHLDHVGPPPALSSVAHEFLSNEKRRLTLSIALGLWALRCADYLLLKPYRETLTAQLDDFTLNQLLLLLPRQSSYRDLTPGLLPKVAQASGVAWLSHSTDPALYLCRLLNSPVSWNIPSTPPDAVLQRLMKWL